MIPDNELARGIQSKSMPGQAGGNFYFIFLESSETYAKKIENKNVCSDFAEHLFASVSDDSKKKSFIHVFRKFGKKSSTFCFVFGGLRTQAPDVFGLNLPSQLVIGYHWLAILNQLHKNQVPNFQEF